MSHTEVVSACTPCIDYAQWPKWEKWHLHNDVTEGTRHTLDVVARKHSMPFGGRPRNCTTILDPNRLSTLLSRARSLWYSMVYGLTDDVARSGLSMTLINSANNGRASCNGSLCYTSVKTCAENGFTRMPTTTTITNVPSSSFNSCFDKQRGFLEIVPTISQAKVQGKDALSEYNARVVMNMSRCCTHGIRQGSMMILFAAGYQLLPLDTELSVSCGTE